MSCSHGFTAPTSTGRISFVRKDDRKDTTAMHSFLGLGNSATTLVVSSTAAVDVAPLQQYFLETCISVGVPAAIYTLGLILVVRTIVGSSRPRKDSEYMMQQQNDQDSLLRDLLNDDSNNNNGQNKQWWSSLFNNNNNNNKNGARATAEQLPSYFKITPLHNVYRSYNYTMTAATTSTALAQYQYQTSRYQQALERIQPPITPQEWRDLGIEEDEYCKVAYPLQQEIQQTSRQLQQTTLNQYASSNNKNSSKTAQEGNNNFMKNMFSSSGKNSTDSKLMKQYMALQKRMVQMDLKFQTAVLEMLGTTEERTEALQLLTTNALPGNVLGRRPLDRLFQTDDNHNAEGKKKKNVYVLDFNGDVGATQVENLREEVSSILLMPESENLEVVVKLSSGGGTVTGYGLAAAQLTRFRKRNVPLTICVEQVAASGGYMMACVADRIVASPLAVLGSIGVISDQPNFYQRLKREGIEFQTVTAGKYKRTLTPTKKVTQEDLDKSKEEIEGILKLFKGFVHKNRPKLDIDNVATGETWFGEDALREKLCDAIATYDDTIADYILKENANVYKIEYSPPTPATNPLLAALPSSSNSNSRNPIRNMIRSLAQMVREEVMSEASSVLPSINNNNNNDPSKYTMAQKDDNEFYF
eukprot:CAMPEP_0197826826 /NCGR_PEP_ID=MMETSP1437-20131217/3720_1 /TAXON_ID=49252 ORGANISM="Eucampia antarctica, Strain CCMP1452" /NCGR_SAMPLE_ID=MMETSP1437 /ASSEMBLY_ACC=CAM_ASM_001096 /LENGTH=641 /DNA_ID=CAMNT_0043427423 /DNA_START=83 /DNA_END=2008 /DNA_ORIENTATION=-